LFEKYRFDTGIQLSSNSVSYMIRSAANKKRL